MSKCGLVGRRLSHSYSAEIHSFYGSHYELIELEKNEIEAFFLKRDFDFVNVTIPYKKTVIPYLDEICTDAESVNTVINKNGRLYGYNTDIAGFEFSLQKADIRLDNQKALILGSGGTSETAQYVCKKHNCEFVVISRSGENNYSNIEKYSDADILINTTPVGMFPDVDNCPVSLDIFPRLCAVVDVIYNPLRTIFTLAAKDRGVKYTNGLPMLVRQAEESRRLAYGDFLFHTEKIVKKIESDKMNTVLIGMPGCGKTTVGKILSDITKKEFIDTDELFAEKYGSPSDFLTKYGEEKFRELESGIISDIAALTGKVIATGGGVPTIEKNMDLLRLNGRVIYLKRPLDLLATTGRPLSGNLEKMYEYRRKFYEKYADATAQNDSLNLVCEKILTL